EHLVALAHPVVETGGAHVGRSIGRAETEVVTGDQRVGAVRGHRHDAIQVLGFGAFEGPRNLVVRKWGSRPCGSGAGAVRIVQDGFTTRAVYQTTEIASPHRHGGHGGAIGGSAGDTSQFVRGEEEGSVL